MTMFSEGIQNPEYDYAKELTPKELGGFLVKIISSKEDNNEL